MKMREDPDLRYASELRSRLNAQENELVTTGKLVGWTALAAFLVWVVTRFMDDQVMRSVGSLLLAGWVIGILIPKGARVYTLFKASERDSKQLDWVQGRLRERAEEQARPKQRLFPE